VAKMKLLRSGIIKDADRVCDDSIVRGSSSEFPSISEMLGAKSSIWA
jgi:hypothetical protein